jgi:hypothetical protein
MKEDRASREVLLETLVSLRFEVESARCVGSADRRSSEGRLLGERGWWYARPLLSFVANVCILLDLLKERLSVRSKKDEGFRSRQTEASSLKATPESSESREGSGGRGEGGEARRSSDGDERLKRKAVMGCRARPSRLRAVTGAGEGPSVVANDVAGWARVRWDHGGASGPASR